jgi:hypothetical protein
MAITSSRRRQRDREHRDCGRDEEADDDPLATEEDRRELAHGGLPVRAAVAVAVAAPVAVAVVVRAHEFLTEPE